MKKLIDVFPAIIKIAPPNSLEDFSTFRTTGEYPKGTRKLDRCRVALIDKTLIVAEDSPEGPKVVFREQAVEYSHEGKDSNFLMASGKIIAISKDHNCGCGSRLRSWNPFASYRETGGSDDAA